MRLMDGRFVGVNLTITGLSDGRVLLREHCRTVEDAKKVAAPYMTPDTDPKGRPRKRNVRIVVTGGSGSEGELWTW